MQKKKKKSRMGKYERICYLSGNTSALALLKQKLEDRKLLKMRLPTKELLKKRHCHIKDLEI